MLNIADYAALIKACFCFMLNIADCAVLIKGCFYA